MPVAPEPGRSPGWPQVAAAGTALVALVVALIGMATLDAPPAAPDAVYRSLQLFVLDGAAIEGLTLNGWLQVARFLAPVATVMAVLLALRGLVGEEWRRRRIARTTDHAIVCGDSDEAIALARNLREKGRAVVLVGAGNAEAPGGGRIPGVPGDPREAPTLRDAGIAGARDLYACAPRSAVNAAIALVAGQLRPAGGARMSTYAQVRSDDLVEALRVRRLAATQPERVTMDFFALDDIAARLLIARHPPRPDSVPVVVGFGPRGQAMLRAILRVPGSAPDARTVVVVTAASDAAIDAEAVRLDAARSGWNVRHGVEADGEGPVYICLADEDEAVALGLRLGRADDRDVVVCLQRESPFKEALHSAARLKIFGVLDEACQEDAIREDSIVSRAARAIHEHYRANAADRGETVATNPSTAPWVDLPEPLKQSNVAQAEHIGVKLGAIGASLTTHLPPQPFAFRDLEIETLAQMEHIRWMEERAAQGVRYGEPRDAVHHPDMREWRNLPQETRDKDRDAVRHLPELLRAEGLYIRRDRTDG